MSEWFARWFGREYPDPYSHRNDAEARSVVQLIEQAAELAAVSRAFELVVNLFTSFGYFDTDDENRDVLSEVRRVIAPRGWFVLDYLNAPHARTRLVPQNTRRVGARIVTQRRRITPHARYVEKHISADHSGRTYLERVRLFDPADLRALLGGAGSVVGREFGNYAGSALQRGSERPIFIARAA